MQPAPIRSEMIHSTTSAFFTKCPLSQIPPLSLDMTSQLSPASTNFYFYVFMFMFTFTFMFMFLCLVLFLCIFLYVYGDTYKPAVACWPDRVIIFSEQGGIVCFHPCLSLLIVMQRHIWLLVSCPVLHPPLGKIK